MSSSVAALRLVRSPAKPGPGPMPEALLRALDLTIRQRIDGLFPGEHRAAALGTGTELAQVRPYVPGDDVRRMDWNVTARTGEPHVRVDVAERVLTTWLALDLSPSMVFGTADRRKADVAAGAALAVRHLAGRRGNRLGVLTFGDSRPETVLPRHGRASLFAVLDLLGREHQERGSGLRSLDDTLRRLGRLLRVRSAVVVVSDFREPRTWADAFSALARRHHLIAIEIQDPREQELADVGELWLVDPETGRQLRVDTSSRRLRDRFAKRAADERRALAETLRTAGADHVVLSTSGDWLRALASSLRLQRGTR